MSHVWLYPKIVFNSHKCGYSDRFFKNFKQRSMTPRWPLTPLLLRLHVRLYPRIIVTKSHGNTSKYLDTCTVTIFQPSYHIQRCQWVETKFPELLWSVASRALTAHGLGSRGPLKGPWWDPSRRRSPQSSWASSPGLLHFKNPSEALSG